MTFFIDKLDEVGRGAFPAPWRAFIEDQDYGPCIQAPAECRGDTEPSVHIVMDRENEERVWPTKLSDGDARFISLSRNVWEQMVEVVRHANRCMRTIDTEDAHEKATDLAIALAALKTVVEKQP